MTMQRALPLLLFAALFASPVAAQVPQATMMPIGDGDARLRIVDYDPGEVVRLLGCVNFQTMVSFADNEHVENVGLGDSGQWQVMPNKRGNLLFVKPTSGHAYSNMTVVTDKRSYNFELKSALEADCQRGRVTYELRFRYAPEPSAGAPAGPGKPADPNAFLPAADKRNNAYTYTGASDLIPLRVFDDGTVTYFKWAASISTPAVYALNSDNTESLINYASRGDYLVVEQVARAYVLRRGNLKAVLYNDAYVVQGLDEKSPKPRKTQGGK